MGLFSAPLSIAAAPAPSVPPPKVLPRFVEAWNAASSHPAQAEASLRKIAAEEPWLADLATLARGRAMLLLDPRKGEALLDSLAAATNGTSVATLARIDMVTSWLKGEPSSPAWARPRWERAKEMGLPLDLVQRVRLRRLRLLVSVGDSLTILPAALEILGADPSSAQIDSVVALTKRHDSSLVASAEFRHSLAGARYSAKQPDSARVLFDSLAASGYKFSSDDRITLGRIHLDLGKINEAIASFRLGAEDPRSQNALLWLGRGLSRVGRQNDAEVAYNEFARRWPSTAKGQEILWGRGMDAEKTGDCKEAGEWFRKVRDARGKRSDWARFREGYCWYRQGQWATARDILDNQRLQAEGTMGDAAWFFAAETYRRLGDSTRADSLWRQLATMSPWSFHGHLARRRVGLEGKLMDSLASQPDSVAGKPVPVAWAPDSLPVLAGLDSVKFLRVRAGRLVGEETFWKDELGALDRMVRGDGPRELGLILALQNHDMGDQAAPRIRRLMWRMSKEEMARAPKALLRLFYPMHFLEDIKPHLHGDSIIDASFVHAVMRQESGFDPFARSSAGAIGLLQLMPATAKAMATKVGLKGYSTTKLTDPAVNLRLGVAYLRDLERIWGGEPALILANYNAGPSATLRWRNFFRDLPLEEAAEEVTYWETRDYIKKCVANWWTYRLLYPEMR